MIASEYGDSFSVWPHLFNEVFQYSINLFKEILIRVLKHHFSIFRDLEGELHFFIQKNSISFF